MMLHAFNRFICSRRDVWLGLGDAETRMLSRKLENINNISPVYVTGLARSGTTIMLELLSQVPGVVTHTYRDFPLLLTPYALRSMFHAFDRFDFGETKKNERPHKDRIMITAASPESMEEVLWMSFFKKLHDETQDNSLTQRTSLPAFERFYAAHIKKLLLVERATRYVSKANYNITRIKYIQKLFPLAQFVLVIRQPEQHIASLIKQHRIFCEAHDAKPSTLEHMTLSGHFEFGRGRKLIHTGDEEAMKKAQAAFAAGRDAEGWAHYWNAVYRYALDLASSPTLRESIIVVHYDEFCANPSVVLDNVLTFCEMTCPTQLRQQLVADISEPSYYTPELNEQERATISEITEATYRAYDAFRMFPVKAN